MIFDVNKKIEKGCLVTAGTKDGFNTMTIGWGMIGYIWNKKAFIAYIRHSRYTYQFMEENDYFTVSFYDEKYKDIIEYLGTHSGRDEDKVKISGLHPVFLDKSVTFSEAYMTLVCKKIYYQDIDDNNMLDPIKKHFYNRDVLHRAYYGEIVDVISKNEEK